MGTGSGEEGKIGEMMDLLLGRVFTRLSLSLGKGFIELKVGIDSRHLEMTKSSQS